MYCCFQAAESENMLEIYTKEWELVMLNRIEKSSGVKTTG